MTTTTAPASVYRTFTREESSAIHNLHIERGSLITGAPGFVEIIYQSNTDRAYGFDADADFVEDLIDVISYTDLRGLSLGNYISQARKNGKLQEIVI